MISRLSNHMIRGFGFVAGTVVLALAGWFGINATDENLSDEARSLMAVPAPPAPSEKNGFLDFLVLGADENAPTYEIALSKLHALNNQRPTKDGLPVWDGFPGVRIDPRIPKCNPAESSCLKAAGKVPSLQGLLENQRVFLQRYRAMRAKPEFANLQVQKLPFDETPGYGVIIDGQNLSLLKAAMQFNSGDYAGAIDELERESAFHRRMAEGSINLIEKMIAVLALSKDVFFAAELARHIAPGETQLWPRLTMLTRPLTPDELAIAPVLRREMAFGMRYMQTRRHVRLPDFMYEVAKDNPADFDYIGSRPWWEWFKPYLYRPHQYVNDYAVNARLVLGVAAAPSTEFLAANRELPLKFDAMRPSWLAGVILNPVGRNHYFSGYSFTSAYSSYVGRMHGIAGLYTLVHLQVALRARGALTPEQVAEALSGPMGSAHLDPFAGKPMVFDAKTQTIGFEALAKYFSGSIATQAERQGRMAIPL